MSEQTIEGPVPATTATLRGALTALVVRLEAARLAATHGFWAFLTAASEVRIRRDLMATANEIAATRPELAARLRRAARASWAQ